MQPWDGTFARRIVQRHQRITSAACLAALAAKGSATRLAPRHYRSAVCGNVPAFSTFCRQLIAGRR